MNDLFLSFFVCLLSFVLLSLQSKTLPQVRVERFTPKSTKTKKA
jgi:hypothetical protein